MQVGGYVVRYTAPQDLHLLTVRGWGAEKKHKKIVPRVARAARAFFSATARPARTQSPRPCMLRCTDARMVFVRTGHLVPAWRPLQALTMLQRFLANEPF